MKTKHRLVRYGLQVKRSVWKQRFGRLKVTSIGLGAGFLK